MLRFGLTLLVSADYARKKPVEWDSNDRNAWDKDHGSSWTAGVKPWESENKHKSWEDNSWQKDDSWSWKKKEPSSWDSKEKKSWETTHSSTNEKPWDGGKKDKAYGASGGYGSTDTWKPSGKTPDSGSLSGGAIAGIVVGSLVGVAIIVFLVVYFCMGNDREFKFDEPRQPEQRKSVKVPVAGDKGSGKGDRTPGGKGGRTPGGKGGRDASPIGGNKLSPATPNSLVGGGKSPGRKSPRKSLPHSGEKKLGETKKTSFPPLNTRDFPKE